MENSIVVISMLCVLVNIVHYYSERRVASSSLFAIGNEFGVSSVGVILWSVVIGGVIITGGIEFRLLGSELDLFTVLICIFSGYLALKSLAARRSLKGSVSESENSNPTIEESSALPETRDRKARRNK